LADRDVLVSVLEEQYAGIAAHPAVLQNISSLRNETTFTVTTGHQLNIFTGPLYFIYKIVTAVKLAQEMAGRFPGMHFVPLYWMASEDHDFAEINHLTINGKLLSWQQDQQGATGKIPTATLLDTLEEYCASLGGEFAGDLSEKVRAAYQGQA